MLINSITWNFSTLFESDSDPKIQENLQECLAEVKQFSSQWAGTEDYLKDTTILKTALDQFTSYQEKYGSLPASYYLSLRLDQEQNNTELRAKNSKIEDVLKEINDTEKFFTLKLSKTSKEFQKECLESELLKEYKHFLFKLFNEGQYTLTAEAEKALSYQSDVAYSNWVSMTDKFLNGEEVEISDKGEAKKVSFNQLFSFASDKDKNTRDSAAAQLNSVLNKYGDVAETEINSVLGYRKNIDTLRGFTRPDQARHLGDDVPSEVVDALIEGVSSNFNLSNNYYEFKAKLMGLEKLAYHERNIPYGQLDKKYEWQDSVELVRSVFAKLDPEFLDIFNKMIENGQFDVYPRAGKSGGAFCTQGSKTNPVYVLLNHTDKLNDVLTLAHEMGHAIHHHMFNKNQTYLNREGSMFTAEVASTFMEDFVLEKILESADDELRLAITMNKLNDDVSTIFRQTACYKFETDLHAEFREKGYLSKEEIGVIFRKNMSAYMGEFVSQDEGSQNWWIYWSHIRSYFYVYSYASGLLISKAMQKNYKENAEYILKIKEFMSAGSSKAPVELFSNLGIDVKNSKFWSESVQSTGKLLEEAKLLAKKLGKI
jgi:oligoendopeptidase F